MAYQNTGDVVDARDVVEEFPVKNTPSCITWYGGRLWIATHTLLVNSRMVAYYLDKKTDKLIALSDYKIPQKVQGVTFDDSGNVYLSTATEETSLPIYIVTTLSRHSQPGRNIRERKWKCLRHRKNSM